MTRMTFVDAWVPVRRVCREWKVDAFAVIATAKTTGVSPDEMLARFEESHGLWGSGAGAIVGVDDPAAVWPGYFDPRLLFQGRVWFDDARNRYVLAEMDDETLIGLIHRLMVTSEALYQRCRCTHTGEQDPALWVERLPLMVTLRTHARVRGLSPTPRYR